MFVLINIRSTDRRKNIFPLGLAYIAACFEKYEKVKVFDLHYKNNMDELYSLMTMETVKFVGFSVCSSAESMYNCASIAKSIKRISPATIIGIGGPHPTYQGREIMARHLEFDVAMVGEGELAATQIGENLHMGRAFYENVNNIIYRDVTNEIIVSVPKKNDVYLLPARHLFPTCREYSDKFNVKYPVICVESTRGCVGRCTFCALKLDPTKSYVRKDLNLFYEDLRQTLISQELETVDLFIVDADFLVSKARTLEIINIIKKFPQIRYFNIASCTDSILRAKDILDDLFEAGCSYIEIGVESFSRQQLERYGKRATVETSIEAIELLQEKQKKYSFSYKIDIILFEPFSTMEDIMISNEYLQKYTYGNTLNENNFFHYMDLFPGTKYRTMAEEAGLSVAASEMDIPYWRFKDDRVCQLYQYVPLFVQNIYDGKEEIEQKVSERIQQTECKNLFYIRDMRFLRTITYDWFDDMVKSDSSQYRVIYEKYLKLYEQIKSKYNV